MKKISAITFWLLVFGLIVGIETLSAFGQKQEIVGEWSNGSVGAIEYRDRTTGSSRPGRGSSFTYTFSSNGTYSFIGYMETTMYNCTSTLFNEIKGKYVVDGSVLHLMPSRDVWKSTNSCSTNGNKQKTQTPKKRAISFSTRTDEFGKRLLCLEEGEETCYRKK